MSDDLRKKRDENFLEFAKRYQEKIGNVIETGEKHNQFNNVLKIIRLIEGRINLLLPRYYKCIDEEIVCFNSPFGVWKSDRLLLDEMNNNEPIDEKHLEKKREELLVQVDIIKVELWETYSKLEESYVELNEENKNEKLESKIATLENRCKSLANKYYKCCELLYDVRNKHTILETFTETEEKLYLLLMDYIAFGNIEANQVSGNEIKKYGWCVVEKDKRKEIYDLFAIAVKENPQKWKLSEDDLSIVYKYMFDERLNKAIVVRLLDIGTPDTWISIIEKHSKTDDEFLKKLNRLEKVIKDLGITQAVLDEADCGENIVMADIWNMIEVADEERRRKTK